MKVKLITIFLLAISAIALVGYISYEGLSKLMFSLESATKPDYRKEHFNELIYSLSEAENSVRVYTIIREYEYLLPFYSAINKVDRQMEILYHYAKKDTVLANHLDSINNLIEKKIDLQKSLIELKGESGQVDVYQNVLEKIQSIEKKNEELDSLENEITQLHTQENNVDNTEVEEEKEKKKGFLKRLFSSSKKKDDKPEDDETTASVADSLAMITDSLVQIADTLKKEKMSTEIEISLVKMKIEEQELSKDLTQAELSLTKKDQEISDLIKLEVEKVERYFDLKKIETAEQATGLFEETTRLIQIVGTISAMLFLVFVFIILNDIQVNQRFRKRLEKAKKRAEDLAAAKEDFLSNMSHEIRTPMNAILGFTEQLNGSQLQKDQQNYLRIIKNASQHLLSIINDILDYNKLEAGKINIEKVPFSISENVNIVYDTLLLNARNKALDFKINIDPLLQEEMVTGDPVRFRQILFNLAGNAIKFTEKGTVEIKIRYLKHSTNPILQIEVRDSGIGISENQKALIFNKFDQADQSISKKFGGTGLGLAIVKKLVDFQKGDIKLESSPGKGSVFLVTLPYPMSQQQAKEPDPLCGQDISDCIRGKKFLVVDDEEYNVLLFETILRKHEAITQSANSGEEACEILQKENFDMVLLDLQMKDMDGFQTHRRIKNKINSQLSVIAITASVSVEVNKRCIREGFTDVIIKPVSEKSFIDVLNKHFLPDLEINENIPKKTPAPKSGIDFRQVYELVQNDKALAMNMINIYLKNISSALNTFIDAQKKHDIEAIREAAHKVVPSTRHMGFEELANKLKFAEGMTKENTDLQLFQNHIKEICSNIEEIKVLLNVYIKEHEPKALNMN